MNVTTGTIHATIGDLLQEHQQIKNELEVLESLVNEGRFPSQKLLVILNNLKKLTLFGHHDKEEQILFKWMLEQNPNADVSIINRIKSEHSELEILLQKILKQSDELEYDLMNFMQMYREHIALEENFIFLIAQGLLTATELNRC